MRLRRGPRHPRARPATLRRVPRCPTCKRPLNAPTSAQASAPSGGPDDATRFAPFCSQRCKLADLHGWLNDRYVISEELPFDESEGRPPTEDA
jgi:endogenous inhibitor of DNA gyrase (YacG/DUF329 family)